MTCNQVITLLEVYRTGNVVKVACGTTKDDLQLLRSKGLIETTSAVSALEGRDWHMTDKGTKKVEAILELL